MGILTFEEFIDEAKAYNPYGEYGYNINDLDGISKFREKQRKIIKKILKGAPVSNTSPEEGPDSPEEKEARRKRYAAAGLDITK